MKEYVLKKYGEVSYVGDIKYELYKDGELNAIIYTSEKNINEVIKQLFINKKIERESCILIDEKEVE